MADDSQQTFEPTLPELEVGEAVEYLTWIREQRLKDITGAESVGITHQIGNWSIRGEYQKAIDEYTNALAILDGYPYIAKQAHGERVENGALRDALREVAMLVREYQTECSDYTEADDYMERIGKACNVR